MTCASIRGVMIVVHAIIHTTRRSPNPICNPLGVPLASQRSLPFLSVLRQPGLPFAAPLRQAEEVQRRHPEADERSPAAPMGQNQGEVAAETAAKSATKEAPKAK